MGTIEDLKEELALAEDKIIALEHELVELRKKTKAPFVEITEKMLQQAYKKIIKEDDFFIDEL